MEFCNWSDPNSGKFLMISGPDVHAKPGEIPIEFSEGVSRGGKVGSWSENDHITAIIIPDRFQNLNSK
jgi:hypothetical protein